MEDMDSAVDRLQKELDRLIPGRNSNSAKITINAGGVGVWIATSACAVMLAINLFLAVLLVDHNRKIDRMQEHLNAIYMLAPHLKPEKDS